MVICELCSKYMTLEDFYKHLSEETEEEIKLLLGIAKRALNMTEKKEYTNSFHGWIAMPTF